jgi:hypothetical protein
MKQNIPSLWSLLADAAFADPEIVIPFSYPFFADVQGPAAGQGAVASGEQTATNSFYFLGRRLEVSIGLDPGAADQERELAAGTFLLVGLEDTGRQLPYSKAKWNAGTVAGNWLRAGVPIEFDVPFALAPRVEFKASFQPLLGFPVSTSTVTNLTTRRVDLTLHGYRINEEYYRSLSADRIRAVREALGISPVATKG